MLTRVHYQGINKTKQWLMTSLTFTRVHDLSSVMTISVDDHKILSFCHKYGPKSINIHYVRNKCHVLVFWITMLYKLYFIMYSDTLSINTTIRTLFYEKGDLRQKCALRSLDP